jgi:hypothetical protein
MLFLGVFIAFCDDSFVISTHEEIASSFNQLSISHWLVTGFNLGWAISLPIVRPSEHHDQPLDADLD